MPPLNLEDPTKLDWIKVHTTMQISNRERDIKPAGSATRTASINAVMDAKYFLHVLVTHCTKHRVISLSEPDQAGLYALLLVGGLRLDLSASTIVIDAALLPPSTGEIPALILNTQPFLIESPIVQVIASSHERVTWKKLLPSFVERCRTWSHKADCEHTIQGEIPLSTEADRNLICRCGQGIGFDGPEWKVPSWADLLPFATRVAISPLFAVSYLEPPSYNPVNFVPNKSVSEEASARAQSKPDDACWVCGSSGKPNLSACGGCKKARYCSPSCQQLDWRIHKKGCRKS
ncbi:hypothetical protein FS749_010873 [Ceratobasidium sp. UAMH 11750]|nr:hypothetical protein FS749_010873 [Ceratobasidium sp. UAMH 11750]